MTSVRQTYWILALAVVAMAAVGCNSWTPPAPMSYAGLSPSVAPSGGMPAGQAARRTVVRSQNAPGTDRPRTDRLAPGSQEHYRGPMRVWGPSAETRTGSRQSLPSRGSTIGQTQYVTPSDPSALWSSYGATQQPSGQYVTPPNSPPSTIPPPGSTLPPPPGAQSAPGATFPLPPANGPSSPVTPPAAGDSRAFSSPGIPSFGLPQGPGDPGVLPAQPAETVLPSPSDRYADVVVNVQETQTGRIMLGAGVNSDLGVTGQIIVDERNFDWRRFPTSIDDILNGKAFRGAGQGFRVEALPGRTFQRYMVQFTEPYLGGTRVSMNLSAYLYDRRFFDWDEQRAGGRFGLGYRLTPDLSLSVGVRGEQVDVTDPRVLGVPELDAALGRHDLYMGQVTLTHDTRDIPFAPTEGHLFELNYSQAFGDFSYPRGEIDFRKYFLLAERADGSGRHVLGFSSRYGFTGSQTPIYENFFAGGHSTMRGFDFREASPRVRGVTVGGEFLMLNSVEYLFPITADDMLKGVLFADYGTVEEKIEINTENYRVALGAGLRIFIPAMGPAPIALDFAVPVSRADTDGIENFSFFIGVGR